MTAHYLKKEHGSGYRENDVVFPLGSRWSYQSSTAILSHANGCDLQGLTFLENTLLLSKRLGYSRKLSSSNKKCLKKKQQFACRRSNVRVQAVTPTWSPPRTTRSPFFLGGKKKQTKKTTTQNQKNPNPNGEAQASALRSRRGRRLTSCGLRTSPASGPRYQARGVGKGVSGSSGDLGARGGQQGRRPSEDNGSLFESPRHPGRGFPPDPNSKRG